MRLHKYIPVLTGTVIAAVFLTAVLYFANNSAGKPNVGEPASESGKAVGNTLTDESSTATENSAACESSDFPRQMQAVRESASANLSGGNVYETEAGTDLAEAAAKLQPGDTLRLKGGIYPTDMALKDLHGTKDKYITISASPSEQAILDGDMLTDGAIMISLDHCSYLRITGLSIQNVHGQNACGISVSAGCHHLIFDRNEMRNITVPDPEIEDHCANGILLFGDSAEESIHDVFLYGNEIRNCATGWAECISVAGHVKGVTAEGNVIDNTGNIGIDFAGNYGYCPDPALDFPTDCRAVNNQIKNCRSACATSYGLYIDGAQNIFLSGNKIAACSGGFEIGAEQPQKSEAYATKGITVENNEISDCIEAGITIGGYEADLGWVMDVDVRGNICRNNGGENDGAILTLSKCRDIRLTGNTFQNDSGSACIVRSEMGADLTKDITFDGNVYGNGQPADQTEMEFAGIEYQGFSAWADAAAEKSGKYQ